jgi:2-phosphosulfolactate phosphatase
MRVEIVLLPTELKRGELQDRVVVVFDVLRATTTMAAALAVGVREILVYPDIESVRQAKKQIPDALACGEQQCLRPEGFDLGNSPGDFNDHQEGKTLLMCTTNGTKAILAARGADQVFTGAIVNAQAVARKLREVAKNVTLLCAGTNGEVAMEDAIGAGAVISFLEGAALSEGARKARQSFLAARDDLPRLLRATAGGRNIIRAQLERDIDFAARLNSFSVVGEVMDGDPIRFVRASQ